MVIVFDFFFDKLFLKKKILNVRMNLFELMVKVIYIFGYVFEYIGYISNIYNYLMKNIYVLFFEYGCKSLRICLYVLRIID